MNNIYLKGLELKKEMIRDYSVYPFSLSAVKNLNYLNTNNSVTFIIGDNGSGKSTLLEAIAVAFGFNAEGGSKSFRFSTFSSHSNLHKYLRLIKSTNLAKDGYFFRAESFYNLATEIERVDTELLAVYGGKSLHSQSHGESFLALMHNRLFGNGIYIFDEPESALSPTGQMALLRIIHELVKRKSQLIIATHSPIIMAYPNATLYEIDEKGICEKSYLDTEHYNITRYFLNNPKRMLKELEITD